MIIGFKAKDIGAKLGIGLAVFFAILFIFSAYKYRTFPKYSRKSEFDVSLQSQINTI